MPQVVVIEENELMRELLAEWLGAEGYEVAAPEDATAPARPELVIVDVQSPRCNGTRTIGAVKQRYPNVPVIAISGAFRPQVSSEGTAARSLGVCRVLAKPFRHRDLIAAVRSLIGPAR